MAIMVVKNSPSGGELDDGHNGCGKGEKVIATEEVKNIEKEKEKVKR